MAFRLLILHTLLYCGVFSAYAETNGVSSAPAMGWSTWSFLRNHPSEASVEAQALAMHNSGLQNHGFVYINLDDFYYQNPAQVVDAYGRWVVSTNTFPDGMAALAAYVHSLGLQFGIYVTPGIPVAAFNQNTPIQGTSYHAQDIVTSTNYEVNYNYGNNCMYYIDYTKPGAQAFVNSWANLFASYGVDYVKIDGVGDGDIPDIEAWSQALVQTGRPIHLELSNSLDVHNGSIWKQYANGWRIEGDVECYCSGSSYPLTSWNNVSRRFSDAPNWTQYGGPGGWNDLDSLEVGNGSNDGLSLTQRQATLTLWSISCAPLLLGVDLTALDTNDLTLLFNDRVLQVNQAGSVGAPLTYNTGTQVWRAAESDGSYAVALFNLGSSSGTVGVTWAQLGFTNAAEVQDLWTGTDLGMQTNGCSASVPSDGAAFYRIAPAFPAFRYLANAPANTIAGGAQVASSTELSDGLKVGSLGNGGTLTFNNVTAPAAGAYNVTFFYENGDAGNRTANVSVNGGAATAVTFAPSGSWTTLASQTISVSLQSGTNSIAISNPSAAAPDIDSLVVQNTVATTPATPAKLTASGGLSQATLTWLAACGATGYQVKYGTASGAYTATNTSATAGCTVSGLSNGIIYYFVVTATNSAGMSTNSAEASTLVGTPVVPTGLTAAVGNAQVILQWNPSFGATSYKLQRSTASGGPYTNVATLAGTEFADTTTMLGTTYYYVVAAVNGAGASANSAPAGATPFILNGAYEIVNENSGLALDNPNGGGAGTGTDQQSYSGTNQQWTVLSAGGSNYKILAANGLALSGPTNDAQLILNPYTGASDQLWNFQVNGSYLIVSDTGNAGQVMDDFGLKTNPGNTIGQWSQNGGNNQNWSLTPLHRNATLTWKGDGVSNTWDVETSTNWMNNGGPDVFFQGDTVTFDDTGNAAPAINLQTELLPGSVTVNASQNYTFSGAGQLSGNMSLTKNGAGTLFLATSNTYTGGTLVSNGTLQVSGSIAGNACTVGPGGTLSGSGTINSIAMVASGGTVQGGDGVNRGSLTIGTLNLGASNADTTFCRFKVASGATLAASTLTLNGNCVINILDTSLAAGTNTLITYSGVIGGSGFGGFRLGPLPPAVTGQLLNTGSAIQLAVMPVPPMSPRINSTSWLPDNNFQLIFGGANGQNYRVWAGTNLASTPKTNWTEIASGTFGVSPVTVDDSTATDYPQRFYLITVP